MYQWYILVPIITGHLFLDKMVSWQEMFNLCLTTQSSISATQSKFLTSSIQSIKNICGKVVECSSSSRQEIGRNYCRYSEVAYQFHNTQSIVSKYFHLQHDHLTVSYLWKAIIPILAFPYSFKPKLTKKIKLRPSTFRTCNFMRCQTSSEHQLVSVTLMFNSVLIVLIKTNRSLSTSSDPLGDMIHVVFNWPCYEPTAYL